MPSATRCEYEKYLAKKDLDRLMGGLASVESHLVNTKDALARESNLEFLENLASSKLILGDLSKVLAHLLLRNCIQHCAEEKDIALSRILEGVSATLKMR